MAWKRPDKKELARMKVLSDLGNTPSAIGKMIKRDPHTVRKHLGIPENFEDPEVQSLIAKIKADEINNLYLLGEKAKQRLHELLDRGDSKMIETTAVLDRVFQQRRLLEGLSTQNLDTRSMVAHLQGAIKELDEKKKRLLGWLEENGINVTSDQSQENP